MLERTVKGFVVVLLVATASITSLTLPTARAILATLPEAQLDAVSYVGLKEIVNASHAQFGEFAADVACAYLKKFNTAQLENVAEPARKTKTD